LNAKPSLTLVRRIKAPPAKVFAAWTEPEMLAHWFGPHRTRVEIAEADPRVGGRFHVVMVEDSGERHDISGTYSEVEPQRKLAFTWGWVTMPERESRVTVTLRPIEDGTELTLQHEQFADVKARDDHREGWSEAFERLEGYLAERGAA
jgi:uncharacterized protein YndB with AHSA1/START domain